MNWALEDRWVSREMGLNFKKAGGFSDFIPVLICTILYH